MESNAELEFNIVFLDFSGLGVEKPTKYNQRACVPSTHWLNLAPSDGIVGTAQISSRKLSSRYLMKEKSGNVS